MTRPVSIACVTHRKGELLRQTLTALAETLGPADEVLVIDDGGGDRPVFEEVAARAPGGALRYVRVPHRGYRLSLLCNLGVMLAAHERIVKIDGDVMPRPGWLAAHRRRLRRGALVCGRIEWRLENGRLARDSRFDYEQRRGCAGPRKSYGGNLGFVRSDLLALGLFATEYHGAWGAEDADVGERYRASGRSVEFAFDAVAEHQWHPPSPYRDGTQRNRRLLQARVRAFAAGRLPKPRRRDLLHVVAPGRAVDRGLESWLGRLGLPHRLWTAPLAEVASRVGERAFVLRLEEGPLPAPSAVDGLYAYLKSEPGRARAAPAAGGCTLLRGSAAAGRRPRRGSGRRRAARREAAG